MKKIVYILSLLVVTFISCNSDIEVNIPAGTIIEPDPDTESSFKVDFDGETWEAEEEDVTATLTEGVINITATKGQEVFTILLLNDQVDEYQVSLSDANGSITYVPVTGEDPFTTEFDGASGTINLSQINLDTNLLSGTFSFTGKRDVDGIEEEKDFTLGEFVDIPFTIIGTEPEPEPENIFFAKVGGVEFVAETILAAKAGGFITISAAQQGGEIISIIIPDNVPDDTTLELVGSDIFLASYFDGTDTFTTQPELGNSINRMRIFLHDTTNKIIEGTFEFNINDSSETVIESGDNLGDDSKKFIITYTE